MDQVIVTLDGKDHKIGYGEHTMCMLPVPHGSTREEGAKECKVCFSADSKDEPPEEVFSIAVEPETLGKGQDPDEVGMTSVEKDLMKAAPAAGLTEPPPQSKPAAKKATKAK